MEPSTKADPNHRLRRLRASSAVRTLFAETTLEARHLMAPLFVREGLDHPREIPSLPGVLQHNLSSLPDAVREVVESGASSIMLFAVPDHRDSEGSMASHPESILTKAVAITAETAGESLVIGADVCLDEFTSHGHCGVLAADGSVDNDRTLEHYQRMSVALAGAGATLLGLSGMMDGQVAAVRDALEQAGHQNTIIMAYSAKYQSGHYGPFRDAVESTLVGDRKTYQMDWRNRREAAQEIAVDVEEGADIVMVKPALTYLDIVRDARNSLSGPLAAYIVSGEHAMLELAAKHGLVERERAVWEALYSVRRAGADIICTYWAQEFARKLTRGEGYRG